MQGSEFPMLRSIDLCAHRDVHTTAAETTSFSVESHLYPSIPSITFADHKSSDTAGPDSVSHPPGRALPSKYCCLVRDQYDDTKE